MTDPEDDPIPSGAMFFIGLAVALFGAVAATEANGAPLAFVGTLTTIAGSGVAVWAAWCMWQERDEA